MTPAEAVQAARAALGGARPAVVAHDAWWALGLELLLPETALLCVQRSGAVDSLRARGCDVFCLSEHTLNADVAAMSAVDVFEHPAALDFCRGLGQVAVVAVRPNERLAAAVEVAGGRLLGSAQGFAAARRLENKLAFVEIAAAAGVATPRWEVVGAGDPLAYADLAARLGPMLVAQAPRGNAGQRTWLIDGQEALDRVRAVEGDTPLRIAELVDGEPFTANGVAGAGGLAAWSEPCRQVTGLDWLTPMELGSSGNVYGDPALAPHAAATQRSVAAIAGALADAGYSGMFGVDFVLGPAGPLVIETNPRLVASLPLATQLEVAAGRAPLFLLHLLAVLDADALSASSAADPMSAGAPPAPPLESASQLLVRRLPGDPPTRPAMRSGVYRVGPSSPPEHLRDGLYLGDLAAPDEALILSRDPSEPVSDGREFARIFLRGAEGEEHPGIREAVAALRGVLRR